METATPSDQLLQRLIDYKMRKQQKQKDSQHIIPIQTKQKIPTSRAKKELNRMFFFNRSPFLSTSELQSPTTMIHSYSPQNHTVNKSNNEIRHRCQISSYNTLRNAQFIGDELVVLMKKIDNNDILGTLEMLSKRFAEMLIQIFQEFSKSTQINTVQRLWQDNTNYVEQIIQKTSKSSSLSSKYQEIEKLVEQNDHLQSEVKSHSQMLQKLKSQFDELQRQVKQQQQQPIKSLKIGTNLEDIRVEQNFQEEFMSKFDEFSLSWRQAAMQQKH